MVVIMNKEEIIVGIHYGHDSTIVVMKDGEIIEAMSEERFSRQKKHTGFPHESLKYIKNTLYIVLKMYLLLEKMQDGMDIFLQLRKIMKL